MAFLDCALKIKEDINLSIEVYRKPTHTNQFINLDSHHPLKHTLGEIKTLQHRAKEISTTTQGIKKEQEHLKTAIRTWLPRLGLLQDLQKTRPQEKEK